MLQKREIVGRAAAHLKTTQQIIICAYKTLTGSHLYDEPDTELIEENIQFLDIPYEHELKRKYDTRYQQIILDKQTGEMLEPITLKPITIPVRRSCDNITKSCEILVSESFKNHHPYSHHRIKYKYTINDK